MPRKAVEPMQMDERAGTSMKHRRGPRFDADALREQAGDTTFARGRAYHGDGHVTILSVEPARVLAVVSGTEDYRTEINGYGREIGGACSCPAFADRGFCKHMVAVALAANGTEGKGALARIRKHLKAKSLDDLVEMIVGYAGRDPALLRRLDMAAAAVHGDDGQIEARLRKTIDRATDSARFAQDWGEERWVAEAGEALDTVAELLSAGRSGLVLKLVDRMIHRLERMAEDIDDSEGHCGALLHRAGEIRIAAVRLLRPDPNRLARELFEREMKDDHGTFGDAAMLYADVLGGTGLREYRRLASEAWEKLPAQRGPAQPRHGHSEDYRRLARILDVFAERDGDVDARIALRAKILISTWSYLQLAEFCLSQSRDEEALRWAEEGLWVFEDDRLDMRLVTLTADLLAKAGRQGNAEAHLWRAFGKLPTIQLYARLRELAGAPARERALRLLEARLAGEPHTRQASADLLVGILMHDGLFQAAWAAAYAHEASPAMRESLAHASEATHPREAVDTYAKGVEQLIRRGGSQAYAQAAEFVARMAGLRDPAEHRAYVEDIRRRFGRKRSFMKLLG